MNKKTMTLIAAALAMNAAFAGTTIKVGTNVVDAVEYCTAMKSNSTLVIYGKIDLDKDLIQRCDDIMVSKSCYTTNKEFDKTYTNWITKTILPLQPVTAEKMFDNQRCYNSGLAMTNYTGGKMIWIGLTIAQGWLISDVDKKNILSIASKHAKTALRKQGKSFVEKDGVNPIQVYVDKVSKALNAPKYNGLQEVLEELEMDYGMTFKIKNPLSDEYVNTLKDDIFYGRKNFTVANQNVLKVYLGIDEYNKFVKVYNEGE